MHSEPLLPCQPQPPPLPQATAKLLISLAMGEGDTAQLHVPTGLDPGPDGSKYPATPSPKTMGDDWPHTWVSGCPDWASLL